MTCVAECARVWLEVPADARIDGAQEEQRRAFRFTVASEGDEFELVFEPDTLRRFLGVAEDLLTRQRPVTTHEQQEH